MFETRTEERPFELGVHQFVPYPKRGGVAEVRYIYCERCGATQPVGSGAREPLGPCVGALVAPALEGSPGERE